MARVASKLLVSAGAALIGAVISSKSFTGSTYRILNKNENYSPLLNSLHKDLIEINNKSGKTKSENVEKLVKDLEKLSNYIDASDDDQKINIKIKALTKKIRNLGNQ